MRIESSPLVRVDDRGRTRSISGVSEPLQRFRLPAAVFPLAFSMNGETVWNVTSGIDEHAVVKELRETGVGIVARSFVGTAMRHLMAAGIAERLD